MQYVLDETIQTLRSHLIDQGGFSSDELQQLQHVEMVDAEDCTDPILQSAYKEFVQRFDGYFGPLALDLSPDAQPVRGSCLP